jgi:glycosyltransferase involved in cell wall biosynthesis
LQPTDSTSVQASDKRLKVLISAYACEPGLSSEPGVGWNTVEQASRFHDLWVLTADEHRPGIERYLRQNPMPNVHFEYVEPLRSGSFLKLTARARRVHYYLWQIASYFHARKLSEQISFDVSHHATYVSYWTPNFLVFLPTPFIWGPVGGGETTPPGFEMTLDAKSRRREWLRSVVIGIADTLDPFLRMTARKAALGLYMTEETRARMVQLGAPNLRMMAETSLPESEILALNETPMRTTHSPFRLISMGRLIGWKGFHLGIQAFARFHAQYPDSEYWIIGDGGERSSLEALASTLGISDSVHFTGQLPRKEAFRKLAESDILVHPSLHETGGWVCIEAQAAGKPVLCLKCGGPAALISHDTGILIEPNTPEQAIADMAAALLELAQNPRKLDEMGERGKNRVLTLFNWQRRGELMDQLYREIAHFGKR